MSRPTCATCRFWVPNPDPLNDAQCRRRAPEFLQVPSYPSVRGRWPVTDADDWCGEHVARLSPRTVAVEVSQETEVRFDDGGKDKPT